MKVLLTKKPVEITSRKTGDKYVLLVGLDEQGGTVTAFLTTEQALEFQPMRLPVLETGEIGEIFKTYSTVNMEFNQRGQLQDVSA